MNSPSFKYVCLLLGLSLLPRSFAHADESPPVLVKISTQPKPDEDVLVGSRLRLIVDVLGRDGWANVPVLPNIEVPGAIVFEPDGQSTRLNDTIQGESYSGQRNEWWVYPRRSGRFEIPPIKIAVAIQTFDPTDRAATATEKTAAISLNAVAPPGFDSTDSDVVVTTDLSVKQSWHGDQEAMKIGDGITRTINRTINGSPPLILPPIAFADVDGVACYEKQPETYLKSDRGELTGSRVDSATYVFKRKGEVKLSSLQISWFDTQTKQRQTVSLDGVTILVADVPQKTEAAESERVVVSNFWLISGGGLLSVGMILAVVLFRERIAAWIGSRQQTEQVAFHHLQQALSSGQVSETARALRVWIDASHQSTYLTFQEFFDSYVGSGIPNGLDSLYRALDCGKTEMNFSKLIKAVQLARASRMSKIPTTTGSVLLPLNPTTSSFQ